MKMLWLLAAALTVAGRIEAAPAPAPAPAHDAAPAPEAAIASDSVVQEDFSDPALAPSQWTLILRPDGSGHFRSHSDPTTGEKVIEAPNVDRDIEVSKDFAERAFAIAKSHKWFNVQCESHLKVAFQGWKTLTFSGPAGHGSCTFNYSRDKRHPIAWRVDAGGGTDRPGGRAAGGPFAARPSGPGSGDAVPDRRVSGRQSAGG